MECQERGRRYMYPEYCYRARDDSKRQWYDVREWKNKSDHKENKRNERPCGESVSRAGNSIYYNQRIIFLHSIEWKECFVYKKYYRPAQYSLSPRGWMATSGASIARRWISAELRSCLMSIRLRCRALAGAWEGHMSGQNGVVEWLLPNTAIYWRLFPFLERWPQMWWEPSLLHPPCKFNMKVFNKVLLVPRYLNLQTE